MNKTASRITAAVMAAAMALSFSSCGKNEAVLASKEHVYSAQKIALPDGLDYINKLLYANEKIYVVGDKSSTQGEGENMIYTSETKMQIIDLEGNLVKENTLSSNDGTSNASRYISNMMVDESGNIIAIENYYELNETTGESKEDTFVVKYDSEGNAVSEISFSGLKEAAMKETGNDYFYVDNFTLAKDGTYLILNNGTIFAADEKGNFKYTVKNDKMTDNSWTNGLYIAGDGRILTMVTTGEMVGDEYKSESKIYEVDLENKKLGNEYPYSQNGTIMNGTEKYDLLISRDSGLFGYDIETGETEIIIDWLKSGIDTTAMNSESTTVLNDGRILCVTYDYNYEGGGGYSWSSSDQVINILTEVDPATIPDKKLIKLYALWLDVGIKRQIVEFNKNSQEYEIELTSYSDYAANNWQDAVTKLNNDMISGNLPDIIVLDSNLPVNSYISKGLLADLYQFMDNDETINRSDFVESVLKAYEVDGKLYELIPSFNMQTIIGKTSEVGENPGWTMDEFIALADANPDKSIFGAEMSRDNFFNSIINACGGSFINYTTGECSFNSDEFIKVLEFSNRFPKEIDYDALYADDSYWQESQNQYRSGKTLLNMEYMYSFTQMRELEQGRFGEPITFKGYPGAAGNGSAFNANTEIAITSKAANPEGAWEFVKYFLSEEYQDQFTYGFPVRKSSLEKLMAKAKEKPYWLDENNEKQEYDPTYWNGSEEIKIGVNTDADNQKLLDLINSTTAVSRYDQKIIEIISEEAAAFFEGQKSAQEVADIIQNRVSNYIAENR